MSKITFLMAQYKYACFLRDVMNSPMYDYPSEDNSELGDDGSWMLRDCFNNPMAFVSASGKVGLR